MSDLENQFSETNEPFVCDEENGNVQNNFADSSSEIESMDQMLSSIAEFKSFESVSSSFDVNTQNSLDSVGFAGSPDKSESYELTNSKNHTIKCSDKDSLSSLPNLKEQGLQKSQPDEHSTSEVSKVEDIFQIIPVLKDVTESTHSVYDSRQNHNHRNGHTRKKLKKILLALETGDVESLRRLAVSQGGLLNDELRKKVWPKLVGVDVIETSPRPTSKEIEAHPYYGQVVLDVNRSLKRFPPSIKESQRLTMLDQLVFLIMRVLCRNPEFHYYQGYHDICVTFLLVLGEDTAFYVVEKLSRTHLNVFMEKNMEPTIHLLEHMYVLIGKRSSKLHSFLLRSEVGVAYCISWLITWFGHVLNEYDSVVRLFDFFIVSHPWMPMYLTTAVVLHRESEILTQECDMASVHCLLSNISDDLPFEELILNALNLNKSYSPKMLAAEHPFVMKNKLKPRKQWSLLNSVKNAIESAVPVANITVPVMIAAAVLVSAVLYQAYKY